MTTDNDEVVTTEPEVPPPKPELEVVTPEGYDRVEYEGETYFTKEVRTGEPAYGLSWHRMMNGQLVTAVEPERLRIERLYSERLIGVEREVTPEAVATEGMLPEHIFVAMHAAGADVATLTKYANEHPDAVRGAKAYQIAKEIGYQFEEFTELKGEERVAKAKALGILPEGYDELPQELKDAYAISDEAFNTAIDVYNKRVIAEAATARAELEATHIQLPGGWYSREGLAKLKETDYKQYIALLSGGGAAGVELLAKERAKVAAELEATLATIKETAPGVITTEDKVTTVNGVTTTTTVTSVVLEEALLAGITEATLIEAGFDPNQIRAAADFVATNTFLPNSNEWMPNAIVASIKEQSEYGYDILVKQGLDAYNKAIDDALAEMAEYERPSGYRLKPAVAAGVSKETLSLIFPKEAVDEAWLVKMVGEEAVPEIEAKPTSGLPIGIVAALPLAGAVAVAEPTFIGEIIVGTVVLGAAAYAIAQGKDLKWGALWDEITGAFKKETGREPTEAEVIELETAAANTIRASAVSVTDMPQAVAIKVAEPIPVFPPDFPRVEIKLGVPPFPIVRPIPLQPPDFPRVEVEMKVPPFPIAEPIPVSPPPFPARIEPVLPQIIAAQVAVAEADDEIATIIKPKVMTPSELDAIWNVPLDKKAQALIALDAAVQDAYTAGEIDEDTLRVYSQARTNYLTKAGLLSDASKAYIGGMQPELVSTTQELAASALLLALSDLQKQATQAATQAYNQALAQGMTQAQAQQAAQTAAQTAIQTASQTAVQEAIQAATQTMLKTATQTAAQTLTNPATQTAVKTAVNTAVATATTTMTQTATTTATGVLPIIPLPKGGKYKRTGKVEPGTVEWRQGIFWRYLEPPAYTELETSKTPLPGTYKFATGEDSAYKTIQVIGGMPTKDIKDIDIGIAIVSITRKGKELEIHFKQDVEDAYKGKDIKEPIMTFKRPDSSLKYHTDDSGKLIIDQEPKKRTTKSRPIPAETLAPRELEISEPAQKERPEKEPVLAGDRYYLGHKLPDSNVRVKL